MPRISIACLALVALTATPLAAQVKPILKGKAPVAKSPAAKTPIAKAPVAKTPLPPTTLIRQPLKLRPNMKNASAQVSALRTANLRVANARKSGKPIMIVSAIAKLAGVGAVNGQRSNFNFEPGGDYEISGSGFGAARGSVFLRHGSRTLAMNVTHWSDSVIYASLPGDVSGVTDAGSVELNVGPNGKSPFKSTKFGFRAAREDKSLMIGDDMFEYDRGRPMNLPGIGTIDTNMAPTRKAREGDFYVIWRRTSGDKADKSCFADGFDRIRWNVPLRNGYEVTGYEWYHGSQKNSGDYRTTGRYAANWDGDFLRIDYAVERLDQPNYFLVGGSKACSSDYKVRFSVTGPRGLSPQ